MEEEKKDKKELIKKILIFFTIVIVLFVIIFDLFFGIRYYKKINYYGKEYYLEYKTYINKGYELYGFGVCEGHTNTKTSSTSIDLGNCWNPTPCALCEKNLSDYCVLCKDCSKITNRCRKCGKIIK